MLKAYATDGTLILGFTRENLDKLRDGEPIHVKPLTGQTSNGVVIFYGESLKDCVRIMEPFMTGATEARIGKTPL